VIPLKRFVAALVLLGLLTLFITEAPVKTFRAAATSYTGQPTTPIQHVVIILKENRSYDEYFGQFPNANGATQGTMSTGQVVDMTQNPTPDPMPNDIAHGYAEFNQAYDNGLNDAFDKERGAFSKSGYNLAYSQMSQSLIPNYWTYADTYGLGDNMFSNYVGTSFANNLFLVSGQSGRYDISTKYRGVDGLPKPPAGQSLNNWWGCDDPVGTTTKLLGADGQTGNSFPCFNWLALPNTLTTYGVSWKEYANFGYPSNIHNSLDAISAVRNNSTLWANDVGLANFVKDAGAGTLPAVSWVASNNSEHPVSTTCLGENESVNFVNAVMNGPQWSSTVIFIVWDEWGGFYDHVPPPQIDNYSYGFRVPILAISPWTKYGPGAHGGSVDSTFFSHASILKFVEDNWNLPALNPNDAGANDMMDFFDFTQIPKPASILTPRTCPRLTPAQRRAASASNGDD
jgi:phospholipase C